MPTSSSMSKAKGASSHPLIGSARFSELVGFLLVILGLLVLCSLVSYFPSDPSFDTSGSAPGGIHNWIGLIGAYGADVLGQLLGWAAYLVPLALFFSGSRLIWRKSLEAPRTKVFGLLLLILSLGALLQLFPYTPRLSGLIQGSGLIGYLVAVGLISLLNPMGAAIVAGALFLTSLFLVTRFSFSALLAILQKRFAFVGRLVARWEEWRERRQAERVRLQIERKKAARSLPVVAQQDRQLSSRAEARNGSPDTADSQPVSAPELGGLDPMEPEIMERPSGSGDVEAEEAEPKPPKTPARGRGRYKLPPTTLLHPPDAEERVDENELKERALRLTEKFAEFGVTGTVTQIHP